MNYQELVDKCRKAYNESNIMLASVYWEEIYNTLDKKLDETKSEEERKGCLEEHGKYMTQFTNEEVYKITDYLKAKAYKEMEEERKVKLANITHNNDLKVLDEFCDFYEWQVEKTSDDKYTIYDKQCGCFVNDEDYDIKGLINRVVGRAIDYFRDEECIEDDYVDNQLKYANKLLEIAKEYKKEDKWEESWLSAFENELKDLHKYYNMV